MFKRFMYFYARLISNHVNRLLDLLLPPICAFCSLLTHTSRAICEPCMRELPILAHHCPQCAQVLPETELICGQCLKQSPPFEQTFAIFSYEAPIIQLIRGLKFSHQLPYASLLADLFLQRIKKDWYKNLPLPQIIIPVPLHPTRLIERGFNQSIEIARPISQALGIKLDLVGVKRIKPTLAQSGLSKADRRTNLKHAFQVEHDYSGQFVVIIDDVFTTGYTVHALAQALRKAGASKIHVWCAARRMRVLPKSGRQATIAHHL